jgi:predicted dehydrogenase
VEVVRLGVIGVGAISQAVHLPAARRLAADVELVVVHDLSSARTAEVARGYGVRSAASAQEVLDADDVDAVLIATPGSHADAVRAALEAGKHVLAEKPLALTIADARDLAVLADRQHRVLQVGYMKMFDLAVTAAAARRSRIGDVGLVRVTVLHPADAPQVAHIRVRPHHDADPGTVARALEVEVEATRRALGDVPDEIGQLYRQLLNGSLIHELSVLRALGIELPASFSHVELWPWPSPDEPPSLLAVAPLAAGGRLVLSWNWLPDHPEYAEEVALFGREGCLRLQMAPPYLLEARSTLEVELHDGELSERAASRSGYESAFVAQLERFIAAVRDGAPVTSTAAGTAEDLRCLQAIVARLGQGVGFEVGGEAASIR